MKVKAKDVDVVRNAPVVVAAAPVNSRQPGSPTLFSELVPHAASLAGSGISPSSRFLPPFNQ